MKIKNNIQIESKSIIDFNNTTLPSSLENIGYLDNVISRFGIRDNFNYSQIVGAFNLVENMPQFVDFSNYSQLLNVVEECPSLNIVIHTKADMFSNMMIGVAKKGDNANVDYEHPKLQILKRPNPLQNFKEYAKEYYLNKLIFGSEFIYPLKATKLSDIVALRIMPSGQMKIIPTGKYWNTITAEEMIKEFVLNFSGKQISFNPSDIIFHISEGTIMQPRSPLYSMRQPIKNLIGIGYSRGTTIYERGANGILSTFNKDSAGAIPLKKEERERIEKDYKNQYGIYDNQSKIIMTNSSLAYYPMTYPARDLLLNEYEFNEFCKIVDKFHMQLHIFSTDNSTTFENQKQAEIFTYQNMSGDKDSFCEIHNKILGLDKTNETLVATYNHLACMQDDKKTENETNAKNLTSIIQLNQAVAAKQITREAAIETLIMTYRFDYEQAKKIISEPLNNNQNE